MKRKNDAAKLAHPGWLSGRLSHKALVALVIVACMSGLLICHLFISYLGTYADHTYNKILSDSQNEAKQTATFLKDCDGNLTVFKNYAVSHSISCEIRDTDGVLVFEYRPSQNPESEFLISNSAKAVLSSGRTLTVRTWRSPIDPSAIGSSARQSAIVWLLVMNVCVFFVVAVALYFLVLSPITRLRKTFKLYYEQGVHPDRSSRQDEIGKLQNTFVDMVDVLENKEQAERQLIASVSHDIKTPLTSILGFSERLLSAEFSPEKQKAYLRNIYDKALVIKGLMGEFDEYLDVNLHDDSPMCLMAMSDFCKAVRSEYQDELSDAGVTFTIDCQCPGEQLRCNYSHMRRFLGNLISNSIQHAGVEPLKLNLVCRREDDHIVLDFSDNGHGVPPDVLRRIFEPFFTTDRGRKVSGLGLTICENVIHSHGGTISARNLTEGGLLIESCLPCAKL